MFGLSRKTNDPVNSLSKRFDNFFNDFFNESTSLSNFDFSPKVDITENEKGIYVKADIPGIDQKDIDVELKDNVLTISGEKKVENEQKNEKEHRIERSFGSFSRSFRVPENIDRDKIKAKYKNGVLNLELPKVRGKEKPSVSITVE